MKILRVQFVNEVRNAYARPSEACLPGQCRTEWATASRICNKEQENNQINYNRCNFYMKI